MKHEGTRHAHNGHPARPDRVQIADTIIVECRSAEVTVGMADEQEYEVVGIVEEPDSSQRYAICYCEAADEFIVTDDGGALLQDQELAQEILDDFREQAEGATEEDS